MKHAYRRGLDIANASFEKQKSHVGFKAEQTMEKVIELYNLGVGLKLFQDDPNFVQHLEETKGRLLSLLSPSYEMAPAAYDLFGPDGGSLGYDEDQSSSSDDDQYNSDMARTCTFT